MRSESSSPAGLVAWLSRVALSSSLVVAAGCGTSPRAATEPGSPDIIGCAASELLRDDGGCQRPGVPPEACGAGFVPDGRDGCDAVLPPAPCPAGQMAVPGDASCRDVAPCGDGAYGDIPVDAETQFVDQAYPGDDSDGTMARPWKTIAAGVQAAKDGAIVAIAAGSYAEELYIASKPVRLWGRCPGLVEITAARLGSPAVFVHNTLANGTEIRSVALTRANVGLIVFDTTAVVIDRVWIHNTVGVGAAVVSKYLATSAAMAGSLIERCRHGGLVTSGAAMSVDATVVRGTRPSPTAPYGVGISVEQRETVSRGTVTVRRSLLDGNSGIGMNVAGADVTVESTVVRGTLPDAAGSLGLGVLVDHEPPGEPGRLTLRASLIDGNHYMGLGVSGAEATVEATVVRDIQPVPGRIARDQFGRGVEVEGGASLGQRGKLILRSSVVERSREGGVFIVDSDAVIESTIVRDTAMREDGGMGDGIIVLPLKEPPSVTITATRLSANARAGFLSDSGGGSLANIEATGNRFGVVLQGSPQPTLGGDLLVEGNAEQDQIIDGDLPVPDTPSALP